MKKLICFLASIYLTSGMLQASVFTESEIRSTFRKHGVRPLSEWELHQDTNNQELVHLGKSLFFDKILSGNKNISCATCHFSTTGTSDNLPVSIGTGGEGLAENRVQGSGHFVPRNAPAAFNMGYPTFHTTMWDERISISRQGGKVILNTPEPAINGFSPRLKKIASQITSVAAAQALFPVTSSHEMRGAIGENEIANAPTNEEAWKRLTKRVMAIEKYREMFLACYPNIKDYKDFNYGHVARAIAAFEMKHFRADKTDFDRFLRGANRVLSRSQIRGASVFVNQGKCLSCHNGPHLTDFKSYSSGMPQLGPGKGEATGQAIGEDLGLYRITNNPNDIYKFKTPTLRNVAITGPWSHAGAYNNLKGFLVHHTDPRKGMRIFFRRPENHVSSAMYLSQIDFNSQRNQDRINSTDERLKNIKLGNKEIDDLVAFLNSLTDLAHYHNVKIPQTVPSGLSVEP